MIEPNPIAQSIEEISCSLPLSVNTLKNRWNALSNWANSIDGLTGEYVTVNTHQNQFVHLALVRAGGKWEIRGEVRSNGTKVKPEGLAHVTRIQLSHMTLCSVAIRPLLMRVFDVLNSKFQKTENAIEEFDEWTQELGIDLSNHFVNKEGK